MESKPLFFRFLNSLIIAIFLITTALTSAHAAPIEGTVLPNTQDSPEIPAEVPSPPLGGPRPTVSLQPDHGYFDQSISVSGEGVSPYSGVRIVWLVEGTTRTATVVDLDESGLYQATMYVPMGIEPGLVQVCVAVTDTDLAEFECADFTIDQAPTGSVTGQIPLVSAHNPNELPAYKSAMVTWVELHSYSGGPTASAIVQPTGSFSISDIPPGDYVAYATGPTSIPLDAVQIDLDPDGTSDIVFESVQPSICEIIPPTINVTEVRATPNGLASTGFFNAFGVYVRSIGMQVTFTALLNGSDFEHLDEVEFYYIADGQQILVGSAPPNTDEASAQFTLNIDNLPPGAQTSLNVRPKMLPGFCGEGLTRPIVLVENPMAAPYIQSGEISWNAAGQHYDFSGRIPVFPNVSDPDDSWLVQHDVTVPVIDVTFRNRADYQILFEGRLEIDGDVVLTMFDQQRRAFLLNKDVIGNEWEAFCTQACELTLPTKTKNGLYALSFPFAYSPPDDQRDFDIKVTVAKASFGIPEIAELRFSILIGLNGSLKFEGALGQDDAFFYPWLGRMQGQMVPDIGTGLTLRLEVILLHFVRGRADLNSELRVRLPVEIDTTGATPIYDEDKDFYIYLWARVYAKLAWWEKTLWKGTILNLDVLANNIDQVDEPANQNLLQEDEDLPRVIPSPAVASGPGGEMLLAQIADTTPEAISPTLQLMVQFWDEQVNAWGSAIPLTDGTYTVNDPTVTFVGDAGHALVAWTQNTLTPETDLDYGVVDLMAYQEIYYAYWNGLSWSQPQRLTNDLVPDGLADIAGDGAGASLVWMRDLDGDFTTRRDWRIAITHWDPVETSWGPVEMLDASGQVHASSPSPQPTSKEMAYANPASTNPTNEAFIHNETSLNLPVSSEATHAPAAELHVCATCTYLYLQEALDAAITGDVIKVAGGVYAGVYEQAGLYQHAYVNKTVSIQGGYTPDNWDTPDPVANPTILSAEDIGRVIYITGAVSPVIEGFHITNGYHSMYGGGVYITGANATLNNNQIYNNAAGFAGGGVYQNYSSATLSGNMITANYVTSSGTSGFGAGIYLYGSDATLVNNVVRDNVLDSNFTQSAGGGIYLNGSDVQSTHNTIASNIAGDGSGIYVSSSIGSSSITLTNTIVSHHTWGLIVRSGSNAVIDNSLFYNSYNVGGDGTWDIVRILVGDPAYAADAYHLTVSSIAAIDEGINTGVLTDIDGEQRPQGAAPDIGADEYPVPQTCYTLASSSPTIIYDSVQSAVDAANPGDTIKIAGTCKGTTERDGRWQTVYVNKTLTLQGGYHPGDWSTPDPALYPTTLDAEQAGRVAYLTGSGSVTIENLQLENGYDDTEGGGVYKDNTALILKNSVVISNTVAINGGGIYARAGSTQLQDSKIISNTAGYNGGGIYVDQEGATLIIESNSLIAYNTANGPNFWDGGGGVYTRLAYVLLDGGEISHNTAAQSGGGVFVDEPQATFAQAGASLITYNTASYGGGIFVDFGLAGFHEGQVSNNSAGAGGAAYTYSGEIALTGAEIVDNNAGSGGGFFVYEGGGMAVLNSGSIHGNTAEYQGGGTAVISGTVSLQGTEIHDNLVTDPNGKGGGIYLRFGRAEGSRGQLLRNSASQGGGLFVGQTAEVFLDNLIIADSPAGGGVYIDGGQVHLRHPTLARNGVNGIYISSNTTLQNHVILTNTLLVTHTTGVELAGDADTSLNGVLWFGNDSDTSGAPITIDHSYTGPPGFTADGWHLAAGSVAIDKGIEAGVSVDNDGDIRPLGPAPDLGADEWVGIMNAQPVVARQAGRIVLAWTADTDGDLSTNDDRQLVIADCSGASCVMDAPAELPFGADSPTISLAGTDEIQIAYLLRSDGETNQPEASFSNLAVLWVANYNPSSGWTTAPVKDSLLQAVHAESPRMSTGLSGETLLAFRMFGEPGTPAYFGLPAISRVTEFIETSPPALLPYLYGPVWQPTLALNTLTNEAVVLAVPLETPLSTLSDEENPLKTAAERENGSLFFSASTQAVQGDNVISYVIPSGPDPALDPVLSLSQQHALPGSTVVVTATVHNLGREPASGLTVHLYAGTILTGTHLAELAVSGTIDMNGTQSVSFEVVAGSGSQLISSNLTTLGEDLDPNNNTSQNDLGEIPAPVLLNIFPSRAAANSLELFWIPPAVDGITGYRILRSETPGSHYELVGEAEGSSYHDLILVPGQIYYYVVQAFDQAGVKSLYSQEMSGYLTEYAIYLPRVLLNATE